MGLSREGPRGKADNASQAKTVEAVLDFANEKDLENQVRVHIAH